MKTNNKTYTGARLALKSIQLTTDTKTEVDTNLAAKQGSITGGTTTIGTIAEQWCGRTGAHGRHQKVEQAQQGPGGGNPKKEMGLGSSPTGSHLDPAKEV